MSVPFPAARHLLAIALLALQACSGESPAPVEPPVEPFDVLLTGGTLYSGADSPGVRGDIGLRGNRIAAIAEDLSDHPATLVRDVSGLAVTPGFIDIHSHAVGSDLTDGLYRWPDAENLVRQGVTLVVGGQDGDSPLPLEQTFEALEAADIGIHYATLVGHGSIRSLVVGEQDRPATEEELGLMQEQVRLAMQAGAFGLSSGLIYAPGRFAPTEEVIALARVAGEHDGVYISHMREEGLQLLESVAETIRIGEEGGLPTQITHHKVVGAPMWGRSVDTLRMVDEAIARGVDVSIDQYPYTASATSLTILFPGWSLDGGRDALLARMEDTEQRARMRREIAYNIEVDRGGNDPANIGLSNCPHDRTLNGLNLAQVLQLRERAVNNDNAADMLMTLVAAGNCDAVFHAIDEFDVRNIMRHPQTMIASDGGVEAPTDRMPHPRSYGTFARVLGHYARDEGVIPVHTAIHKMTQLPADRLGLAQRGRLEVGAHADVAVLDLDAVQDMASFEDPHQYAQGAMHVFVAGEAVLLDGAMTGARPGTIVRSTDE